LRRSPEPVFRGRHLRLEFFGLQPHRLLPQTMLQIHAEKSYDSCASVQRSYLMDAEIRQIVLWLFRILPLTFRQRDKAIGFYTRKNFTVTIRPTNFDAT